MQEIERLDARRRFVIDYLIWDKNETIIGFYFGTISKRKHKKKEAWASEKPDLNSWQKCEL